MYDPSRLNGDQYDLTGLLLVNIPIAGMGYNVTGVVFQEPEKFNAATRGHVDNIIRAVRKASKENPNPLKIIAFPDYYGFFNRFSSNGRFDTYSSDSIQNNEQYRRTLDEIVGGYFSDYHLQQQSPLKIYSVPPETVVPRISRLSVSLVEAFEQHDYALQEEAESKLRRFADHPNFSMIIEEIIRLAESSSQDKTPRIILNSLIIGAILNEKYEVAAELKKTLDG